MPCRGWKWSSPSDFLLEIVCLAWSSLDQRAWEKVKSFRNFSIRFLANDLRTPLGCLGTEESNQALMTDQQLADRFATAELPAWDDDAFFEQLLLSVESILPLRLPSTSVILRNKIEYLRIILDTQEDLIAHLRPPKVYLTT
jgi:hypothetical protein